MTKPPPPFSYTFSPNVPELLQGLNCSLAVSTYQTGKVVIFSAKDQHSLIQLPRTFPKPMGMARHEDKWAIALIDKLIITSNAKGLAPNYPASPNTYDALFVPRASYYTGPVDMHDLAYTKYGWMGVNTSFSCLSIIDEDYSFKPFWKPSFITDLKPEDRCHLNGMAIEKNEPRYVTALSDDNESRKWKPRMLSSGVLIDVKSGETILSGLAVPHSPRIYDDKLYMLLSATGEVVEVDVEKRNYTVITQVPGFTRGMDRIGDYLFVATSKLRPNSSIFKEAPVAEKSVHCGISIIYLPTGILAGYIMYNTSVEELFDVMVLPGMLRPNILNEEKGLHKTSVVTPQEVFWSSPEEEKSTITEQKNTDKPHSSHYETTK